MKNFVFALIFFFPVLLSALNQDSAIVVGKNVRVRTAPNLKGRIITSLDTGSMVQIIGQTEKPERLIESREFHYHWYEIEYNGGKTGWIYGQFLYRYRSNYEYPDIVINNRHFQFLVFFEQDFSYDMPNESSYSFPCFYDKKTNKTYPLYKSNMGGINGLPDFLNDSDSNYTFFRLEENTGGGIQITENITQTGNTIYLPVGISFQDGGASATLVVRYQNNRFTILKVINYENMSLN